MSKLVLGIDIRDTIINVLEAKPLSEFVSPVKYFSQNYNAAGRIDAVFHALYSGMAENYIFSNKATLSLSGTNIIYETVVIPHVPDDQVYDEILARLGSKVNISSDDIVMDYKRIHFGADNRNVYFVCIVSAQYVSDIVKNIKRTGVRISDIVPACEAIKNSTPSIKDKNYTLVFVDNNNAVITIIKDKEVAFSAELKDPSDKAVLETIKELKRNYKEIIGDTSDIEKTYCICEKEKFELLSNSNGYIFVNDELSSIPSSMRVAAGAANSQKASLSLLPKEFKDSIVNGIRNCLNIWTVSMVMAVMVICNLSYLLYCDNRMSSELRYLENAVKKIDNSAISKSVLIKKDRFYYSMNEIDSLMPENIYLQDVKYDRSSSALIIKGVFESGNKTNGVSLLLSALKKSKAFENVKLSYLKKSD